MLNKVLKGVCVIAIAITAFNFNLKPSAAGMEQDSNAKFYSWLLDKKLSNNDLTTNELISEKRFQDFLRENITVSKAYYMGMTQKDVKDTFYNHLNVVLGGPPDTIELDANGTFLISACRFRSCPEKGFVWIDTKADASVFGILAFFLDDLYYSNGILAIHHSKSEISEETHQRFKSALVEWLSERDIKLDEMVFMNN